MAESNPRSGANPFEGLPDESGLLLRTEDGTLYFIPDAHLEGFELPQDFQPGAGSQADSLQSQLDRVPPVYRVKNALRSRGGDVERIVHIESDDGSFRPKVKAEKVTRLGEETDQSRSTRTWQGGGHGFPPGEE